MHVDDGVGCLQLVVSRRSFTMHIISPQVAVECVDIQLRDQRAFNSSCQLQRQGLICSESSSCPFISYGKCSSIYRVLRAARRSVKDRVLARDKLLVKRERRARADMK